MIQGLKITVPGTVVKDLLEKKAAHHRKRASDYQTTYETLIKALGPLTEESAPKMSSVTDSRADARNGAERHTKLAAESAFRATYVNVNEDFLLDNSDLHHLGILEARY